ncbi:hypothetical protein HOY80DRAFT_1138804 [Tuber brumale]|nr:hypothetical protein HOY80DRAFT_1138804 [Tuber brumale]
MAFAQRGHPAILPTVTTHIHSLSGVSFRFRIPMLMCWRPELLGMLAIAIVIVLCRRSVVLTRSSWKVITCGRRKMVLVVGKYEHPVEATSMGKSCSSLEIMEAIGRKPAGSS